jgi:hypothetical protein
MTIGISGEWMIVELGDAQVAGLPEAVEPLQFDTAVMGHKFQF